MPARSRTAVEAAQGNEPVMKKLALLLLVLPLAACAAPQQTSVVCPQSEDADGNLVTFCVPRIASNHYMQTAPTHWEMVAGPDGAFLYGGGGRPIGGLNPAGGAGSHDFNPSR